jgi:hypothetical protein
MFTPEKASDQSPLITMQRNSGSGETRQHLCIRHLTTGLLSYNLRATHRLSSIPDPVQLFMICVIYEMVHGRHTARQIWLWLSGSYLVIVIVLKHPAIPLCSGLA